MKVKHLEPQASGTLQGLALLLLPQKCHHSISVTAIRRDERIGISVVMLRRNQADFSPALYYALVPPAHCPSW